MRVSTDEQAEHGYSLAHQREECRRRARELGATSISEFADEGVSGSVWPRPGLAALLDAVRERGLAIVVAYDPDRLARKLSVQLHVTDILDAAKCKLEFVKFERRDTSDGQLLYVVRGAIAEYEKAKIRERTMNGRRQKAKSGKMPSGFRPYGYIYDRAGQTLLIDDAEAPVVRRVFRMLVEDGMAVNGIAARLTAEGVPTRRGAPAWQRVVVRQILGNPVYAGTFFANRMDTEGMGINKHLSADQRKSMRLRPREEWVPIPVPAIVDENLWQRAQEILSNAQRLMHDRPRSDYLLTGLLSCGVCGLPMCGTRRKNWGKTVRGYTCRRAWSGAKTPGCGRYVTAEPLEEAVWGKVTEWLADPDRLVAAVTEESGGAVAEQLDAELERVETALREAEKGRRNIMTVLERSLVDVEEGAAALERTRTRIDALEARKRELQQSLLPRAEDVDQMRAWAAEWLAGGALDEVPFAERRQLVRHLIVGIAVHEATLVMRARLPLYPARIRDGERDPDAPAGAEEDPA